MFWARVRRGGREGRNSLVIEVTLDRIRLAGVVHIDEEYIHFKKVGNSRDRGQELTDQRRHNRPEIIVRPSEANNDEELPLIPSHPDLLNLSHVSAEVTWTRGGVERGYKSRQISQ